MDHPAIKDLLSISALGGLDPDDERALAEHLAAGCAECEAELKGFREAAAAMAIALAGDDAGGQAAPQSTDRIWRRLEARLSAARSSAPVAPRPAVQAAASPAAARIFAPRATIRTWRFATVGAMAAALAIAVYAGVITHAQTIAHEQLAGLTDELLSLRADIAAARARVGTLEQAMAERIRLERILMASDVEMTRLAALAPAPGASALVAVSRGARSAIIQAADLPPTPAGKTYELWWITRESGPVAAGLFQASPGREVLARAELPPPGQHLVLCAVTLEPAGGVAKPTGDLYLKGTPPRLAQD